MQPDDCVYGDGPIWCAEGPKIRIAGVAAREIDDSCRERRPCPTVSGPRARDLLVNLFGGPRGTLATGHVRIRSQTMRCKSDGSAGGSRTAAWCSSPVFGDLSWAAVKAGGGRAVVPLLAQSSLLVFRQIAPDRYNVK